MRGGLTGSLVFLVEIVIHPSGQGAVTAALAGSIVGSMAARVALGRERPTPPRRPRRLGGVSGMLGSVSPRGRLGFLESVVGDVLAVLTGLT